MHVNIPTLLRSKKFGSAVTCALVVYGCLEAGIALEWAALMVSGFVVQILGQGIADLGKGAEQAKNGHGATPAS